jgi:hypothetical protein
MATLTEPQRTALEAAILAHLTAQGARYAGAAAAFKAEAQLGVRAAVQTSAGGAVLAGAWAASKEADEVTALEVALCVYLASQDARLARAAAAFENEAQLGGDEEVLNGTVCGGEWLEQAWGQFMGRRTFTSKKLYDTVREGDVAEVQLFVWMGTDVEAMSHYEWERPGEYMYDYRAVDAPVTPLYWAARYGRLELVKYFVALGHSMDVFCTACGFSALMIACENAHSDVAEYLLDRGCDRVTPNGNGTTALHVAARLCYVDIVELLCRHGAILDARDKGGRTPADCATGYYRNKVGDAIRAEEERRLNHGFKRDRSTIEGTEEHEAAKRPRVEEEVVVDEVDASDDDDDDDDDDDES